MYNAICVFQTNYEKKKICKMSSCPHESTLSVVSNFGKIAQRMRINTLMSLAVEIREQNI